MTVEAFRPPPLLAPSKDVMGRLLFRLRRWADLQVASLYPHLASWLRRRTGDVLEVGCGAQPYRHLLPGGVRYQGLDWDRAAEVFGYQTSDTSYFDGGLFPFPAGTFDSLWHTEVLEHIPDMGQFLRECHRVLRPGGEMVFSVPFQARYHYIPHDYWRLTPAGIDLVLSQAGFRRVCLIARGNDLTVAAYKSLSLFYRVCLGSGWTRFLALPLIPLGGLSWGLGVFALALRPPLVSTDDCLGYFVHAVRD